jgi:ADP-ribose pyrophosphatase
LTEIVTSTKRIYDGKIINLRVDTVLLQNEKTSYREIVEHHGAIAIVPITDAGSVLMVRQFRLAAAQTTLEIPAGSVEAGEDVTDCAHRELAEEVHLSATSMKKLFQSFVAPGYSTELIHTFLATGLSTKTLEGDDDEFLEIVEMPLEHAIALIGSGDIQDSKTISGLLYVKHLEAKGQLI